MYGALWDTYSASPVCLLIGAKALPLGHAEHTGKFVEILLFFPSSLIKREFKDIFQKSDCSFDSANPTKMHFFAFTCKQWKPNSLGVPASEDFSVSNLPLRELTIRRSWVCCSVCMRNGLRFTDSKQYCFADDEKTALHEFRHWWNWKSLSIECCLKKKCAVTSNRSY